MKNLFNIYGRESEQKHKACIFVRRFKHGRQQAGLVSVGLPSFIFCIAGTVSVPAYVPSQYTAFVFCI